MTSAFHVYFGPEATAATPRVRRIGPEDCFSALKEGLDDFFAMPTYPIFVGLFYAVAGIALFAMTSLGNALHLVVTDAGIAPAIRAALEADAISVTNLQSIRPSLEDAFVALTTRREAVSPAELSL